MKLFRPLLFLILISPLTGNSQTVSGIVDTLTMMMPSEVILGSDSYQQEIKQDEEDPCRIHFRSIRTDSRGRMNVEDFYFNAFDLDLEGVKSQSSRKTTRVEIPMKGGQAVIEYYKDQIPQNYSRSFKILARDADNGNQIVYQVKKMQAPCEALFDEKYNFESADLEQLLEWVVENTQDVIEVEGTVGQEMTRVDLPTGEGLELTRTSTNSKGETRSEVITANAGDLDGQAATLDIRGRNIVVNVPVVAKQKYVQTISVDKRSTFGQQMNIRVNTIEDGRSFLRVLERLTPMARELMQGRLRELGDKSNALTRLQAMPLRFEGPNGSTRIELSGDCMASWKLSQNPERGSAKTETYRVFLQDLDKAEMIVNPNSVEVELQTIDRLRYIEMLSGGERQSYTNQFSLPVEDIETAKIVNFLIEKALAGCRTEPPRVAGDKPEELMNYLRGLSGKVSGQGGEIEQSFSAVEANNNCLLRITHKKDASRGAGEMVYEFEFSDIDPESVRLYVSGKTIGVDFNTRRKETLITAIKDGEPEGFENGLRVWAKDLEQARVMAYTIQSLAVSCSE